MGTFFPSNSHLMVYFIIWEMHGFSHQFLLYEKMQQNPSYGEDLGNWYSCFSYSIGAFLQSDSHPVIYFITWEMLRYPPSVSHSIRIFSEIHRIERAWKIGTHTFPKVWVLFFIRFSSYGIFIEIYNSPWCLLPHGKCMAFPINFP